MSLLTWWSSKKVPRLPAESSGLSGLEATRPAGKRTGVVNAGNNNAQPANRKGQRMAQRELLYAVVRDAMVRAGVLSSSYKFKVLSLDSRGRKFMVMVDLDADQAGKSLQFAEIEALIAQSAKSRYEIIVTAVYWRRNDHVAVGDPRRSVRRPAVSQPETFDSGPAPLESGPAPLESGPEPAEAIGAAAPMGSSRQADLRPDPARRSRGLQAGPFRGPGQRGRGRGNDQGEAGGGCARRVRTRGQRPRLRRLGQAWSAKLHAADRVRGHRTAGSARHGLERQPVRRPELIARRAVLFGRASPAWR